MREDIIRLFIKVGEWPSFWVRVLIGLLYPSRIKWMMLARFYDPFSDTITLEGVRWPVKALTTMVNTRAWFRITCLQSGSPIIEVHYMDEDRKILEFIYSRLVNVHKENPHIDYMIALERMVK